MQLKSGREMAMSRDCNIKLVSRLPPDNASAPKRQTASGLMDQAIGVRIPNPKGRSITRPPGKRLPADPDRREAAVLKIRFHPFASQKHEKQLQNTDDGQNCQYAKTGLDIQAAHLECLSLDRSNSNMTKSAGGSFFLARITCGTASAGPDPPFAGPAWIPPKRARHPSYPENRRRVR